MSKISEIKVISEINFYDISKSSWFGKNTDRPTFKLALLFYSPEGCDISMPLASISAYIKNKSDSVEIKLFPVFDHKKEDESRDIDQFSDQLFDWEPDLIAISLMSPHWYPMDDYLLNFKSKQPSVPILIGGYQPIMSPDQTINHPAVDFICVGDGEYAAFDLIQFLRGVHKDEVSGLWEKLSDQSIYKSKGLQIENIYDLPFPDYTIFDHKGQFSNLNVAATGAQDKFIFPVMTGRGCPYKCTYCCNTPLLQDWETKKTFLRKYDPEKLVEELCRLRDLYGIEYFEFWDELFMSNIKFVKQFLLIYKEQVNLPFSINSRVEVMSESFCQLVADAGCHTIWFGIESGDEEYRTKTLGRKMTNEKIIQAAENCKKVGIQRLTFNIVGMPFESKDQMLSTLALNKIIAPEFFFFFTYIPLRGTPLYNTAKEKKLLVSEDDKITQQHYLDTKEGKYLMNIHSEVSAEDFDDICQQMHAFQQKNNRLTYKNIATTDVKSLQHSLPSPKNIYAHAMLLEHQQANHLHFGLFKTDTLSLEQAQEAASQLLLDQLPAAPCDILVVGLDLGFTLNLLSKQGYNAQGISSNKAQISYIHNHWHDLTASHIDLADFSAEQARFDVLLFQESAHEHEPLDIYNQALNLLRPLGHVLIIDEFKQHAPNHTLEDSYFLQDFITLAKRFKFDLVKQMDLSSKASPSLAHFLQLAETHQTELLPEMNLSEQQFQQVKQAIMTRQTQYANGQLTYTLLHFHKNKVTPKWQINTINIKAIATIQPLFEHAFTQPISADLWSWKYANVASTSLAAWADGQLIGHYGGVPRNILYFGQPAHAIQICDVMVEKSYRGILSPKGVFFQLAATFLERNIGLDRPFLLGFGFPNEKAMKLAEHLELYAEVGEMVHIKWPILNNARPRLLTQLKVLDNNAASLIDPLFFNTLWNQMAVDFKADVIAVRDWDYFQSRYLNHPEQDYQFLIINNRMGKQLLGIAVIQQQNDHIEIIDLITPVKNIALTVLHVRRFAKAVADYPVFCRITKNFSPYFMGDDASTQSIDIRIPANVWTQGPLSELNNHWWLMSGDMDSQ